MLIHSQKRASCSKSVDILQELVTTSQNRGALACMACYSLLTTSLLKVVNTLVAQVNCPTDLLYKQVCESQTAKYLILTGFVAT